MEVWQTKQLRREAAHVWERKDLAKDAVDSKGFATMASWKI
jgi:hypothetical protein